MSPLLLLIIIGALLLLLAIGDSIKRNNSSNGLINAKLRIPLGVIGILLLIFSGYSYGLMNPQPQIEQTVLGNKLKVDYPLNKVKILSPVQGDVVKCRILTMGVYPENHTKDIWVLLKPANDDYYYPQSDYTNTSYKRDGEWQVVTRFGGDEGEGFDIIVYETDASASSFFSSTIEEWKTKLEYPGLTLEEIPSGATEVDRIVVTLGGDCRGVF